MRILVIGSGAREHALAWRLSREPGVSQLICAPGNAGIEQTARLAAVDATDPESVYLLADAEQADLTVIGPELPLTRGVADLFAARGRLLLGPSRLAAELESSKAFAKDFMGRHGVPTARYQVCDSPEVALAVLATRQFGYPLVIKADGLAAGKGVVIAHDQLNASMAIRGMMVERRFGDAGARIVIEEFMQGQEASIFALTDGRRAVLLPTAQDHKRAFDGDAGPNTGGMGAFAPSPLVDDELLDLIRDTIILPVIDGMRAEGREFRGFLYAGLMLTADGPKVVEFNVRMGDPEAQVVLPMIDGDLAPLLRDAAAGRLGQESCRVRDWPRVGVVIASKGYPGQVRNREADHRPRCRGGGAGGAGVPRRDRPPGERRRDGRRPRIDGGGRGASTTVRRSRAPTRAPGASSSTAPSCGRTSARRRRVQRVA